ncbi:uncharacterized protein EV154DRAFT_388829, partial [Mucor mucedo]|uniref:uncharacterized protein n=1 Tax=Mucor mucedo TaxID=29922 RepID=UPI0022211C47
IFMDASDQEFRIVWDQHSIQGQGTKQEQSVHINQKELLVIDKVFQFIPFHRHHNLQLCMDNTSAIAYIKHFGGPESSTLNTIALDIWTYCFQNSIQLSTLYV